MNKKDNKKSTAMAYHEATKHSYLSIRSGNYYLDWGIKPSPYKTYNGFPKIELPKGHAYPTLPTLESIKKGGYGGTKGIESIAMLSEILQLSYGLTAKKVYPGITYYLRSSPSAGALYPVEIYICINGIEGLTDGLYHYSPYDSSIHLIRKGDLRGKISAATGGNNGVINPQLNIFLTTIFWRSSWKYQERAYRYCLLDTGHLIGNILAVGSALNMGPSLIENFIDKDIDNLLGIDGKREAVMAIITFDRGDYGIPPNTLVSPDIQKIADPLDYPDEKEFPLINQVHDASSIESQEGFIKIAPSIFEEEKYDGEISYLSALAAVPAKEASLGNTITSRRSSRDFHKESIPFELLSIILHYSFQGYRSDITDDGSSLLDAYLVINGVNGISPGIYYFDRDKGGLGKIRLRGSRERNLRGEIAYLCLEQGLCGNASALFFFVTDLDEKIAQYGNRIYRYLHLEAGILGENIYLTSTALGIGATGIGAFFDNDLADFLGIAKDSKKVLYVMAIGVEKND